MFWIFLNTYIFRYWENYFLLHILKFKIKKKKYLQGANLSKSQLLNSLASSKSNNQNQNNQNAANQAIQTANNITNAFASQVLELPPNYLFTQSATPRDPRYLLSK